jgi:hypothetical protein
MATTMAALSSASIRHAEFVRLTVDTTEYTFCNAAAPITADGITFTALGALLALSDVQRDIKATSDDLTISLTGIDQNYVSLILSSDIKGSIVEVWRGFLDSNNQIITSPTQQFFKRYKGIINNVSITEDFNEQARTRVATCSISCASFRLILENRMSGIKTNPVSWKQFYPSDTSMDRTPIIQNQYFDFGAPPTSGSVSVGNSSAQSTTSSTSATGFIAE